jgi:membrane protein
MSLLKKTAHSFYKAIQAFINDNCFQYSAAVSFYTLFSLAPIVLISVYLAGIFVGNASVMHELTRILNDTIGQKSTQAVLLLVETIHTDTRNGFYLALSIAFLIISATTVFIQFKESFNRIFQVIPKTDVGFLKVLMDRAVAFGMIILLGAAMILSLITDSLIAGLFSLLLNNYASAQLFFVAIGTNLLTLILIFGAVLMMFYILPDVKMRWKPLIYGSFITTILLVIGKFGVAMIIGNSPLNQLSGASSSIIILMLWVYYSCIILFFGIELVKAFAEQAEGDIKPKKYARRLQWVEYLPKKKEPENT